MVRYGAFLEWQCKYLLQVVRYSLNQTPEIKVQNSFMHMRFQQGFSFLLRWILYITGQFQVRDEKWKAWHCIACSFSSREMSHET